jgi:hypothetical protein
VRAKKHIIFLPFYIKVKIKKYQDNISPVAKNFPVNSTFYQNGKILPNMATLIDDRPP